MGKKLGRLLVNGLAVVFCTAGILCLCSCGQGTTGPNEETVETATWDGTVTFTENGKETKYMCSELGFTVDENGILQCDTSILSKTLAGINEGRSLGADAVFVKEGDQIVVQEAKSGDQLDEGLLSDYLRAAVSTEQTSYSISLEDFYDTDFVSTEELQSVLDDVLSVSVSYGNGITIFLSDYAVFLDTDGSTVFLTTDETRLMDLSSTIQEVIEASLGEDYPEITNGFVTSDGIVTVVEGGTWKGPVTATLDLESEAACVLEHFKEQSSETDRTPCYAQDAGIVGTYVEVSLNDQHVWHYLDGTICCETDCTTGNLADGHDTPTGFYDIIEMVDGKYLWPKGATEGTWVDKWMRITWTGYGLHDAQWRADEEFGGDNYLENGSHGCVNLPMEYAYHLYDSVYLGMPVIIYENRQSTPSITLYHGWG
jgi:hypothetical protein